MLSCYAVTGTDITDSVNFPEEAAVEASHECKRVLVPLHNRC